MPDGLIGQRVSAPRVFVVIPARNEQRLLPVTIASVPDAVERIVVVDDGSSDRTVEAAREAGGARLEVIVHVQNRGVGAAIVTGYRRAFKLGADIAVVMGADAQMDAADMPRLIAPIVEGRAGYVKGDRLSHPDCRRVMPKDRWIGNHVLSALTRLGTGLAVHDAQCGYTALHRDAAAKMDLDGLWPRYGYPNDLLGRCVDAGVQVQDVVVRPVYGTETSGIRWRDALVRIPMVIASGAMRRRP